MKRISILDVVLVIVFLTSAIVGGVLKVFDAKIIAAIVAGALALLAARVKLLGGKTTHEKSEKQSDDAVPDKPLEPGHSHRIIVEPNGTVKVEDVPDEPKSATSATDGK